MTRAEFKKFAEEYAERIASVAWKDGYKDGYEAGEIAMREKAAQLAELKFESAPSATFPVYGFAPMADCTITVGAKPFSDAIRALLLSSEE